MNVKIPFISLFLALGGAQGVSSFNVYIVVIGVVQRSPSMIPDSPLMTVIPGHGDYPDTGGPGKQSPAIITDYYNTGSHPATSDAKITA